MVTKAKDIVQLVNVLAPPQLAEKWDNCGWQVGDPESTVTKVMLALDVTEQVVKEAQDQGAGLIICHHPLLFEGVKSIVATSPQGKLIYRLIQNGIGVYAAHTNLDSVSGGVNAVLAEVLGLKEVQVLHPVFGKLLKLVVFVPQKHADAVRQALGEAGAGWIGNYSHCTFNTNGQGTFMPLDGTDPFIGSQGRLELVEEVRIETVVKAEDVNQVLSAMLQAHPYEEVAYDIYPLENKGQAVGLGRMGILPKAMTLAQLAVRAQKTLQAGGVRYGGNPDAIVQNIAVCGGSGADFWELAKQKGAQVLVTGDVRYHVARDMQAANFNFIDAGHFPTEQIILTRLAEKLNLALKQARLNTTVTVSRQERDVWVNI